MIELKISRKVYNGPCLRQRPVFPWRLLLVAFPRFIEKGGWLKFKWLSYPCGDRVSTPSAHWGNFNKGLMGVETGLREPLGTWAPRDGGSENMRTAPPQICRGREGRSQSSTIACRGRKTLPSWSCGYRRIHSLPRLHPRRVMEDNE